MLCIAIWLVLMYHNTLSLQEKNDVSNRSKDPENHDRNPIEQGKTASFFAFRDRS